MKRVFLLCSLLVLAACAQPAPPPPPSPPPPPPPPPEHNFTVFFDWDKANITPEGQQIIEAAAGTFKSQPPVPVQVIGHTDTSGSAAYNQKLSVRRADAVAGALTQAGVPQTAMTVTGVGQNDLKVPTPDGVREPQNRRTEIIEGGTGAPPPPPPTAGKPVTGRNKEGAPRGRPLRPALDNNRRSNDVAAPSLRAGPRFQDVDARIKYGDDGKRSTLVR